MSSNKDIFDESIKPCKDALKESGFSETNHTMHKIFNRNTVKISYSCLRIVSSFISSHNRNILSLKQQSFGCNCRVKNEYPLNGECQTLSVVYQADVVYHSNDEEKFYYTTFKERYRNHNRDFKQKCEHITELAKSIWQLKRDNISFSVKWTIITKVSIYFGSPNLLLCKLCLTEKLWIIKFINDENMLNKKSELVSKCRHLNKHFLRNVKKK